MKVTALICARGGSKGLPGKNLRLLQGRPLIAWAVHHARSIARVDRVIVSTDSQEIGAAARHAGADVPFVRPAELARDDSPEWMVWRHALAYLHRLEGTYPDALMIVPTTAPLRAVEDLDRCIDEYEKGGADAVITVTEAHRSPFFNMVMRREDGTVGLVMPAGERIHRRQDAPPVFDMTTVGYVVNPTFVMERENLFQGRVRQVLVPVERALDIDTLHDFNIAECLLMTSARLLP